MSAHTIFIRKRDSSWPLDTHPRFEAETDINERFVLLAAVEKCKRLFAMNPMRVQQGATRGFAYPHQAPEDRIFGLFLSDTFNAVMSVSPETVPDTRSEQFRRTVQRRAGNYRRH